MIGTLCQIVTEVSINLVCCVASRINLIGNSNEIEIHKEDLSPGKAELRLVTFANAIGLGVDMGGDISDYLALGASVSMPNSSDQAPSNLLGAEDHVD